MIAEREQVETPVRPERAPTPLDMSSLGMVLGIGVLLVASLGVLWAMPDLIRYMRIRRM
jgi:hypothetical protein